MTEDFLHYVWRTKQFDFLNLRTTGGQPIKILDFGQWNLHGGPDFKMARILLDGTEWAGNIELHLVASDWHKHHHSSDPAYRTVILHVVLEEDSPVYIGGQRLPCLELKSRVPSNLLGQYLRLMASTAIVPCASFIPDVAWVTKMFWLERMLIERLEVKAERITVMQVDLNNDWNEILYRLLALAFGFKLNAGPFERLSRLLPLMIIRRHTDNAFQIEALVYGCAGLLNRVFQDVYPRTLQQEFTHLSDKYGLSAIDAHAWNWGGTRPANFPTRRLAQFAAVLQHFDQLMPALLRADPMEALVALLTRPIHGYWEHHSDFDRDSAQMATRLGRDSAHGIIINTIAPFLVSYGRSTGNLNMVDRAVTLLCALPREINRQTSAWQTLGMPHAHAGHSQGLIHLKAAYCDARRCVDCAIGNQILNLSTDG